MQTPYHLLHELKATLAALALWLGLSTVAAQIPVAARSHSVGHAEAPTNAAPAEPKIPKSVFVIPTSPHEGRDPFYPESMRLFASAVVVTPTNRPIVVRVELQLKALSGPANHRLAIINNHTFEAGEEEEVTTSTGRARIRCLAIRDDCVVVLVGGEQRVLHLRAGI
jgi:hypothetical protein